MRPWRQGKARRDEESVAVMRREVGAQLEVEVIAPTTLEFQIAVPPQPATKISESLSFAFNGRDVECREIIGDQGSRIHTFSVGEGTVTASYSATIIGRAEPAAVRDIDVSTYLRPSRYAEVDKVYGFATTEFGQYADSVTLLEKVSSWVGTRLDYVPGSSDPIDGAADTLLAGAGVCRDYAHLVIALLRAVNVPARLVSVYAPGCDPMDFHAVVEACVEGAAPRYAGKGPSRDLVSGQQSVSGRLTALARSAGVSIGGLRSGPSGAKTTPRRWPPTTSGVANSGEAR